MSTASSVARLPAFSLTPRQRRALRDGLIVAGLIFNANLMVFWLPRLDLWIDAKAWWTINLADIYGNTDATLQQVGAFRYSPAIAWLFAPSAMVSWPVLIASYLALNVAAVAVLVRRWMPLFLLAFPPVLLELLNGNIAILLALAIWAGMRWPAAWSFVLLSKVTVGVGLLWFAARREWRNLGIALGVTAAIVAVGFVIAPQAWTEWFQTLVVAASVPPPPGVPPLVLRLPVAGALTWWAARTGRAWVVPIACFLAQPILWLHGTAILLACFPLYWQRDRWPSPHTEAAA